MHCADPKGASYDGPEVKLDEREIRMMALWWYSTNVSCFPTLWMPCKLCALRWYSAHVNCFGTLREKNQFEF